MRLNGAVALAFLGAALWLGLACLLSGVVNRIFLAHQTLYDVAPWLVLMLTLILVRAGLIWASEVYAQRSANDVKRELRACLMAKLLALGPAYTQGERTGELVHATVQGIEALDEYISQYLPARLLAGLVPALVFGFILIIDPWTLPILLFTGPILLILFALIGGRTKEISERRFQELSWMSAHFLDILQGLPTLKMFGRNKEQAATIETISRLYGATTMQVLRTAFQTSLVLEWGATAATALVAITVSVRLMNGLMPFDLALTVLLLTPEFFAPLRQLALKYHAGATGKAATDRIYAILDTPSTAKEASGSVLADYHQAPPLEATSEPALSQAYQPACHDIYFDDIYFDDVYVTYDDGQRPALTGFSMHIAQEQTVALVGPTGAGKTTVANLLLRFIEPTQGRIIVGGMDLRQIEPAAWRKQIAWVPQRPHLFHATVAENLRLAKPDASWESIIAAARAANAHEFIEDLPRGYETPIGERGARLSGGQRQRIAIARAFLKNAPLLILDEATSHLDSANEELLQDALARLMENRTVLIITHRLQLANRAELIAVMDGGRVVQQGAPLALTRESGSYRRLIAAYEGVVS